MSYPRLRAVHLVFVLLGCVLGASAAAHNGEPPPPPPQPPVVIDLDLSEVVPLRWSWVHWWEANRDLYLAPLTQGPKQKADPAVVAQTRSEGREALRAAMEDPSPGVRRAAAFALGRIADPEAAQTLRERAQADPDEEVRLAAIISLGLIGGEEHHQLLREARYPSARLRRAGVLALGLLPDAGAPAVDDLMRVLDEGAPAEATLAAWSLRGHAQHLGFQPLLRLLQRERSPWLASEVLLALGYVDDPRAGQLLETIVRTPIAAISRTVLVRLPAWEVLAEAAKRKQLQVARLRDKQATQDQAYQAYLEAHERWQSQNPNPPAPQDMTIRRTRMALGAERLFVERLRASAAIALARRGEESSVRALLDLLEEPENSYNALSKGFALMSLAQIGDPAGLDAIAAVVRRESARGHLKTQDQLNAPLRGIATLALGLYARPAQTPQGPVDRFGFERAFELLAERLSDDDETLEVRSAAAVGLGLSTRGMGNVPLVRVGRTLGDRDWTLAGYVLLGRGMLGDVNLVADVQRYLQQLGGGSGMGELLGQRAAILGLGVRGMNDAVPLLTEAWHLGFYRSREVIRALGLLDAIGLTTEMVKQLRENEDAEVRAYMAEALGEMLSPPRPRPIDALVIGSNYTMRNQARMDFSRLVNPFLFDYLTPALGVTRWQ